MPDKPNFKENFASKSPTLSKKAHLNLFHHAFGSPINAGLSDKDELVLSKNDNSALNDKNKPDDKGEHLLPAIKYRGVLAGFPYIGVVDLAHSQGVITSRIDLGFASIPDNKYNCHEYVRQFIEQNYDQLPSKISPNSMFPSDRDFAHHNYYPLKPVSNLSGVELQQGDIVCVIDNNASAKWTHSGIVIGFEKNNTPIIRQKLTQVDPVVDMTPQGFDLYELKENNNNIPIPSTKHVVIYRHLKPTNK